MQKKFKSYNYCKFIVQKRKQRKEKLIKLKKKKEKI